MPIPARLIPVLLVALAACSSEAAEKPGAPDPSGQTPGIQAAGRHGTGIELGTATIAGRTVRAARDAGDVVAGGEVPVDVWVEGGSVEVVRFWIGPEDAKGALKVRASIEDPAHPDHWHTHAEAPDPLPGDARLWVELEVGGQRSAGSFDLKR